MQLRTLYDLTADKVFDEYATRWDAYQQDPANRIRQLVGYHYYRWVYQIQRLRTYLMLS